MMIATVIAAAICGVMMSLRFPRNLAGTSKKLAANCAPLCTWQKLCTSQGEALCQILQVTKWFWMMDNKAVEAFLPCTNLRKNSCRLKARLTLSAKFFRL
jgi:hypothetical protein